MRRIAAFVSVIAATVFSAAANAATSIDLDGFPPEELFEPRDLYPDFVAAVASDDATLMARGYAAWERCAGFALSAPSLEAHIAAVLPAALSPGERERRARYIRLSAKACNSFLGRNRLELFNQAEDLQRRLAGAGDLAAQFREAYRSSPTTMSPEATRALACNVLTEDMPFSRAVRYTGPALTAARLQRQDHMLNSVSAPARNIAVNLAFCDLHPAGCTLAGSRGNWIGSICVHEGRCGYRDELEYWAEETAAEVWQQAQPLRAALLEAYTRRDCGSLF